MEQALNDKDELKLRVHSYISEVSRVEKLMAAKVKENLLVLILDFPQLMLTPRTVPYHPHLRSRRTGTCWSALGWPAPSLRSRSSSCRRPKALATPSAWSCSPQTRIDGDSESPSATRRERSSR